MSTSLSGPKSSRNMEPNKASFVTCQRLQKVAISSFEMDILGFIVSPAVQLYTQPFFAAIEVQYIRSHRMLASEFQSVELFAA